LAINIARFKQSLLECHDLLNYLNGEEQ
jgi:hypothetical protein